MNDQAEQGSGPEANANREKDEFFETLGGIEDPVLLVLRAHLYFEYLLERIIHANLKRGDILLEHGSLTFSQKLSLVRAFDCIEDDIATVLRHLNKIRNQCAHERQKQISLANVELIGRPLGSKFTTFRKENAGNIPHMLGVVVAFTAARLARSVTRIEATSNIDESPSNK